MALSKEAREFFVSEGRKGGKLGAKQLTPEQRQESARRAAEARWAKTKKLVSELNEGAAALLKKSKAAEARAAKKKKAKP